MRFGPVPLAQAAGAVLAHSTGPLRKGRVLSGEDCDLLAAAGVTSVIVARMDPGDVAEDAAAMRIARALVPDPEGQGLAIGPATTGRVNLSATGPGVIRLDAAAIGRLNAVEPMITLATVADWQRCEARMMVATVKIISYAVPEAAVAAAEAAARGAIHRLAPVIRTASLIETVIPGHDPGPKGKAAMAARLERLGVSLEAVTEVAHDEAALAAALATAPGDLLLILTASATSDPADVAPAALRRAGGVVDRFGMPVDPGNLLFIGALDRRPVIGLPGCARSPALNGADWVLERVVCGAAPDAAAIGAMGVGGLLKEIPSRPRPRSAGQVTSLRP